MPHRRASSPRLGSLARPAGIIGASILLSLLVSPVAVRAQGPPINTQNAFVTGLSGAAFRTFYLGFNRSGLRIDGEKVDDPLARRIRVRGQVFLFPYELLANRLVVLAAVPFLDKTLEMGPPSDRKELSVTGFGDLAIAAKLGVYQRDRKGVTTRVALFGRLKLPTGDNDAVGPDGRLLPRRLQLGSGSVDVSTGVIVTHSAGPLGLSGDLIYDLNTASDGFALGDVLHYDLALGYRILPRVYRRYPTKQINLYLEANGTWSQRDTAGGVPLADSGGGLLVFSPGVQFIPLPNLALEATLQIPVWQGLNGAQLAYNPTFKAGLRWLLF